MLNEMAATSKKNYSMLPYVMAEQNYVAAIGKKDDSIVPQSNSHCYMSQFYGMQVALMHKKSGTERLRFFTVLL